MKANYIKPEMDIIHNSHIEIICSSMNFSSDNALEEGDAGLSGDVMLSKDHATGYDDYFNW